ncbi:MAG TPA: glycosyltransferase [Anaerolineaceae bacterium]
MNILILCSSYPRFPGDGTAPFVQSIALSLAKLGNQVDVVVPWDPLAQPMSRQRVEVHRFQYIFPKSLHIMGHARSLKSDTDLNPLTYLLLPFFLFFGFIKTLHILRARKSEILNVHWVLPNGLIALFVSWVSGIPLVVTLHGSDIFVAQKNFLFGWIASLIFHRSKYVTACSPELAEAAQRLGASSTKVKLIAWGADPQIFKPEKRSNQYRSDLGFQADHILVAALGRMVYKKGFNVLLDAWSIVVKAFPKAVLVMGGDGPLRDSLTEQAAQLGILAGIKFLKRINWDDVPAFLASMDIFILPSIKDPKGNIDGLPTVLLEAMSSGLPVIASEIAGVPLVINNYENGVLVPPGNPEILANAIIDLIQNEQLRVNLGTNARHSITTQYNWDEVGKIFIQLYQQAIDAA